MPRRSVDWNEGLAKDLKDPKFARGFIMAALEDEALSPQVVLRKVVLIYGVKEFAKRVKMQPSNLSRALNPKYNPTVETLNRLLKPFGLRLAVAPLVQRPAA